MSQNTLYTVNRELFRTVICSIAPAPVNRCRRCLRPPLLSRGPEFCTACLSVYFTTEAFAVIRRPGPIWQRASSGIWLTRDSWPPCGANTDLSRREREIPVLTTGSVSDWDAHERGFGGNPSAGLFLFPDLPTRVRAPRYRCPPSAPQEWLLSPSNGDSAPGRP